MASIIIVGGPNEGDYYPLGTRTMVVGRGETCPVQVVDDRVSRKHLQIRHDEGADCHHALDMKSANGVFINGRRVDIETALQDGDIIEIGDSKIMFSKEDFPDRDSAMENYKKRGERFKQTLGQ